MAVGISGIGIVCAIGNDAGSVLGSLRRKESGIATMRYLPSIHKELPVGEVKLSSEQMKRRLGLPADRPVSRTTLMGAIAIREALSQAGLADLSARRVALISGTTVGVMDITETYYERMKTDSSLELFPHSNECGRSTVEMARLCGLDAAECCTVSTACSSSLNAIILGAEMLRRDEVDVVIAGGSEALSKLHLNGFNSLMILDRQRCRPFDAGRAGLNLGEGAAYVVLQNDVPQPLALVSGYANRCDAFHQTASSENGEGAFLAMAGALEMAGLRPQDIRYVNAHGTGTPNNDASESRALRRIFGSEMPEVSSTKAYTGHATSASGSIETVICILAMQHGFTPASLGWETPFEGGVIPTPGHDGVRLDHVLCNAFGFGGNDSALILSRPDASAPQASPSAARACVPDFSCREAARVRVDSDGQLSVLREYLSPMESRRMGKLLKAGHLSALQALQAAGISRPDAIISATSRGMLENSTLFLEELIANAETLLKPTLFMQSTHNTLASALAIRTGCHGYNVTYSSGDESAAWALRDARRLIATGQAASVLVVSFDETLDGGRTGDYFAESFVLIRDRDE